MKSLDLAWQREQLEPEMTEAINEVLSRGDFINGAATSEFESSFGAYIGAKHCVGCGNGTDALELILEAMGIGPGDEVIVPAMTYVATSEAVLRVGASVILADVSEAAVISESAVIAAVTPRTKAVITVHLYGYPVDVETLQLALERLGRPDVVVIEDAAQAHGASRRDRRAGSLGAAASFSFYPGKNLGAFGDAGAVTTDDAALAERIRRLANHGRLGKFDHELAGRNSRMDSLQGAVLGVKLTALDAWLARRRAIAQEYLNRWSELDWLDLPQVPVDGEHAWHQFAVLVPDRAAFTDHLRGHGIPLGVHYPEALPEMSFHSEWPAADFPHAMKVARHEVSIPVGEHLSAEEVDKVVEVVGSFCP